MAMNEAIFLLALGPGETINLYYQSDLKR